MDKILPSKSSNTASNLTFSHWFFLLLILYLLGRKAYSPKSSPTTSILLTISSVSFHMLPYSHKLAVRNRDLIRLGFKFNLGTGLLHRKGAL